MPTHEVPNSLEIATNLEHWILSLGDAKLRDIARIFDGIEISQDPSLKDPIIHDWLLDNGGDQFVDIPCVSTAVWCCVKHYFDKRRPIR
jgi:hypothetical protein